MTTIDHNRCCSRRRQILQPLFDRDIALNVVEYFTGRNRQTFLEIL